MRKLVGIFLFSAVLFSCEEQFGIESNEVPQNTIDYSKQLFSGRVLEKSSVTLDDIAVWKVKIEASSGAIVTFYWQKNYTMLYKIDGEKGPYTYELNPPMDLIIFSTAKFLAFESYSSETLQSWQLVCDSSQNSIWVYQFFLSEREKPITINAKTGDVL